MKPSSFQALIMMCKVERTFFYHEQPVLTLSIRYPRVMLRHNIPVQNRLNCEIIAQVDTFYTYVARELYEQAIAAYQDAMQSGFPFHGYEAILQYEVTYNANCHFSLYRDQYEFTGGAHGSTIRASDSWNLMTGYRVSLCKSIVHGKDCPAFFTDLIARQIQTGHPEFYFEDYQMLALQNFNEKSFYLTPTGVSIYYQQYEIAPYSTGIPTFTIPYEKLGWYPSCEDASGHPIRASVKETPFSNSTKSTTIPTAYISVPPDHSIEVAAF